MHKLTTYRTQYEPSNKTEHRNNSDVLYNLTYGTVSHHSSPPTITHGTSSAWSNYSRLSNTSMQGTWGPWHKDHADGSAYCTWGSSGSKHTEIIRIGNPDYGTWMPQAMAVTGLGFEVFRHRTDSTSFTNDNANQHCIFVKRYGLELRHKSNDSIRFYSSEVLATEGTAKFSTYGYDGGVATEEFYSTKSLGGMSNGDYYVKNFWFNLASRDTSKVGTATTKVYIHDLRLYYDYRNSHRVFKPAFKYWNDREKAIFY